MADCTIQCKQKMHQWSFYKTGTMETLASQAEIGVYVQTPGALLRGPRVYHPVKILEIVYA